MPLHTYARIHHFFPHPTTGEVHHDEDGDPILGFYYEFVDEDESSLGRMMGPYSTTEEVEKAAHRAWRNKDY